MDMIYLAAPYRHPEGNVMLERLEKINKVTAYLIRNEIGIYSPITNSGALHKYGLPNSWSFWKEYDTMFLSKCKELWILTLKGWEKSEGIAAEKKIAKNLKIPIFFLENVDVEKSIEKLVLIKYE